MGNRAVITNQDKKIGVYVHWNGGLASVTGFCEACKELNIRNPNDDDSYGFAGLAVIIGVFFGYDGLSLGVNTLGNLDCDNWNNGVYVIGPDWEVIERYGSGSEALRPLLPEEREKADAIKAQIVEKLTKLREMNK